MFIFIVIICELLVDKLVEAAYICSNSKETFMSSNISSTPRQIQEQIELYQKKFNQKITVLVMDDDEMCLKLVKHQLEHHFKSLVDVECCASYDEFLQSGKKVDIAVVDYFFEDQQSQHDGLAVLTKLKALNPATTVYMMTGHKQINLAVQAMKIGAADYIIKGDAGIARLNENILELIRRKNTYNKRVSLLSMFQKRSGLFL